MKRFRAILLIIIASCFAICLVGCSVTTVDQMYQIPKRSDAYNNLQSAIDSAMNGLSFCAPLEGENQQTVQMCDLDGDGIQEYLLFAKGTQEKPLKILVFKENNGSFHNIQMVDCNGSAFDRVEYVDMDGDHGAEIVIGCQLSDQIIHSVSIYSFINEELQQLGSAKYTKFLTADLDGNGNAELFVLRPGKMEGEPGIAELYSMHDGALKQYNTAIMSQTVDRMKRVVIGKLDGGKNAVYVASAMGETALVTDVYTVQNGRLLNVSLSNEAATSVRTMRNFYIYADDPDKDLVIELPDLIPIKPLPGRTIEDMHHIIRWFAMTPAGEEVDKMYTYHNFVDGWYLQLDISWAQRVSVVHHEDQTELYLWDEEFESTEKLMTVYAFEGQDREEKSLTDGRFVLQKTDVVTYAAYSEPLAEELGLTPENIVYSFRLIQQEWKTGET